jgi:hypothetical protein
MSETSVALEEQCGVPFKIINILYFIMALFPDARILTAPHTQLKNTG